MKRLLEILVFIFLIGVFTGIIPAIGIYILEKYPIAIIPLIILVVGILGYELCFRSGE